MANHVLARVRHDEITIVAEGLRQEIGAKIEMDPTTSFDLGSITKILSTTSLVMKLCELKTIGVHDEISEYLPEWKNTDKARITIGDLLQHQSGLTEWRPLYISSHNPTEIYRLIASDPLKYPMRSGRHYSDLGFIILGHVIEVVTTSSLDTLFYELVARPLELSSTQFAQPREKDNVAATSLGDSIELKMISSGIPYPVTEKIDSFKNWRSHVLVGEVNDGNAFHGFAGIAGHAGLFSTAHDLALYIQELWASVNGEGYFSEKVIREFLTESSDPIQALGFRTWQMKDRKFYGHTGFPGVACGFTLDGFGFAYLSNRIHTAGDFPSTDSLWMPLIEREINP